MNSAAVFLDKDGTLIENVPYNVDLTRMRLNAGALECTFLLQQAGYQLVVVSNQSGVAQGFFHETKLIPVERHLRRLLEQGGVDLSGFYYCPHHPRGSVEPYNRECTCRKPKPGMLLEAAEELQIDLSASWLIGDILNDVEAGKRAGCRTILLDNGHETEWNMSSLRQPDFMVRDLLSAAEIVLSEEKIGSLPKKQRIRGKDEHRFA